MTISKEFGDWGRALHAAGLLSGGELVAYRHRIEFDSTTDRALTFLAAAMRDCGPDPNRKRYRPQRPADPERVCPSIRVYARLPDTRPGRTGDRLPERTRLMTNCATPRRTPATMRRRRRPLAAKRSMLPSLSRSPVGTARELAMPAAMSATTVMSHTARWAPRVR